MHRFKIAILAPFLLLFLVIGTNHPAFDGSVMHARLGGSTLSLEVADTQALRTRGLSGHKPLTKDEGMLFAFPIDGRYGFWMKEMLFPIDIVWLDKNYSIVDVAGHATPDSYPKIFLPNEKSRYVVELPVNYFLDHGLARGDSLEILP